MARIAVPTTPDTQLKAMQTQLDETSRKTSTTGVSLAVQDATIAANTTAIATVANSTTALASTGQHGWHGVNGSVSSGSDLVAGGWVTDRNAGIAVNNAGLLTLGRVGRWSLSWQADSDSSVAGIMRLYLAWPGGAWTPSTVNLSDCRWRGTGFGGAGALSQCVHWSGWVDATAAASPIGVHIAWGGASNVACTVGTYALLADYLGGASS